MMGKIWRWVRWPLLVLGVLFAAYLVFGFYLLNQKSATEKGIAQINSHKLTLADVQGVNLPPAPNQIENDATVAGIDKNNNGIRDDVELAIFKKYPNDAKVRAAELQYAMALQTYITDVFNSDTWVSASDQESRGYLCIGETYPRTNLKEFSRITDARSKEVEDFVLNTAARQQAKIASNKFEIGSTIPNSNLCDINLNTL